MNYSRDIKACSLNNVTVAYTSAKHTFEIWTNCIIGIDMVYEMRICHSTAYRRLRNGEKNSKRSTGFIFSFTDKCQISKSYWRNVRVMTSPAKAFAVEMHELCVFRQRLSVKWWRFTSLLYEQSLLQLSCSQIIVKSMETGKSKCFEISAICTFSFIFG